MPIHRKSDDPQDQSITERNRALGLFTNRLAERRLFTRYLNEETPRNQILYFHGDGGNGKSLLFDLLEKDYCHRVHPKDWQRLNAIEKNTDYIEAFSKAEVLTQVPSARLDFGARETGDDRPREDWSGLLMLRRELGPQGFQFPTFDFGITLFLHKTRQLSKAKLKSLFPQEESDLAAALIDLVTEGAYATLAWRAIGLFDKTFLENMTLWNQKRGLDKTLVEKLAHMDPQAELRDELPHLLAQDLNAALQVPAPPYRVVLFFDTHEAFWGSERLEQSPFFYFQQDEWLRRFLGELYKPNYGVIAVVAGREPPRWAEPNAGDWRIDQAFIDTQLIGQLSREDAEDYLRKAGITDATLITSLINFAEVEPNQAHPLHLGLCADVVLEAEKRGNPLSSNEFAHLPRTEEKGQVLINRLLKYCTPNVRAAVEALAAARAFDLPLYLELGRALHLHVSRPDFRELTKFSFIRQEVGQNENRFRIHDLLRRILAQIASTEILAAHHTLEIYYHEKAETDPLASVELIYHINQQDWERGYTQWIKTFEGALERAQYALCEALVTLRPVLFIGTQEGWSNIAWYSGSLHKVLSRHKAAEQTFREALEFFEHALKIEPENENAHNNKGNALGSLGQLQASLSHHTDAEATYREALAAFDRALACAPESVEAHNNKGVALGSLGQLQASLSHHTDAEATFREAIAAYDRALALAPEYVEAHANKGITYKNIAEIQFEMGKKDSAKFSLTEAVTSWDRARSLAENDQEIIQEGQKVRKLWNEWFGEPMP